MPGADSVQDVPREISTAYLSIGFLAFLMFVIGSSLNELNKESGGDQTGDAASDTEKGAWGAMVILLAGFSFIVVINKASELGIGSKGFGQIKAEFSDRDLLPVAPLKPLSGYIKRNPRHPSPWMERSEEFYDPAYTPKRKQKYYEPNVQTTGLGHMVMKNVAGYKPLKDEYPGDYDYSRDPIAEAREEARAARSRKLSESIRQREQRQAEERIQMASIVPSYGQIYPSPGMYPAPSPFGYGQPVMGPYPMASPVPEQNKPLAIPSSSDDMKLLPPYPVGHPLRDDNPYGIVFVILVIAYVAIFETMRSLYLFDAEGKARKPKPDESFQIEMFRTIGSVVLAFVSYLTARNFVDNNPGTGSGVVAIIIASGVGAGAYVLSGRMVENTTQYDYIPSKCFKYKYENFKNKEEYITYVNEMNRYCRFGKENEARSLGSQVWYTYFWDDFFWYWVVFTILAVLVGLYKFNVPVVIWGYHLNSQMLAYAEFFLMLIIVLAVFGNMAYPFRFTDPGRSTLEKAKDSLTDKLVTECPGECGTVCRKTMDQIIRDARRECVL